LSSPEDVRLRRWREDDLPALVKAMNDPEIVRWMVFADPFTDADGRRWLETHLPAQGSFVIAGEDDGLLDRKSVV